MKYLEDNWKAVVAIVVGVLVVVGLIIIGDRGREVREDDVYQGGMGVTGTHHLETP